MAKEEVGKIDSSQLCSQISQPPIGDHERHMQFIIRERLRGTPPQGGIKSKGALLLELARDMRVLREELEEKRYGKFLL